MMSSATVRPTPPAASPHPHPGVGAVGLLLEGTTLEDAGKLDATRPSPSWHDCARCLLDRAPVGCVGVALEAGEWVVTGGDSTREVAASDLSAPSDAPRTLKDPAEVARRRALLSERHVAPLAEFVQSLRGDRFGHVPDFDPLDGGVGARALFLFEKPGPKAAVSGFISRNNNDSTAEHAFRFMVQAGLSRDKVCLWNVIPGWNDTVNVTSTEVREGIDCLSDLLVLLPGLRAVVMVGRKAERARRLLEGRGYELAFSWHPSPKNYSLAREKWLSIPETWASIKPYLT